MCHAAIHSRRGRTRAERRLRETQQHQAVSSHGGFVFPSIAVARTSFRDRRGTPRQSLLTSSESCAQIGYHFVTDLARLEFHPDLAATVTDLAGGLEEYSHLWILFVFHENTSMHGGPGRKTTSSSGSPDFPFTCVGTFRGCSTKIVPPCKRDGVPVGVFASRSPHRPNPLGLSLVK